MSNQHANQQPNLTLIEGGADNVGANNDLLTIDFAAELKKAQADDATKAKQEMDECYATIRKVVADLNRLDAKIADARAQLAPYERLVGADKSSAVQHGRALIAAMVVEQRRLNAERQRLHGESLALSQRFRFMSGDPTAAPEVAKANTAAPAVSAPKSKYAWADSKATGLTAEQDAAVAKFAMHCAEHGSGLEPRHDSDGKETGFCSGPNSVPCCSHDVVVERYNVMDGNLNPICYALSIHLFRAFNTMVVQGHGEEPFKFLTSTTNREAAEGIARMMRERSAPDTAASSAQYKPKKIVGPYLPPKSETERQAELAYKKALTAAVIAILEPQFGSMDAQRLAERAVKKFDDGTPAKPSEAKSIVLRAALGKLTQADGTKSDHEADVARILAYKLGDAIGLTRGDLDGAYTREKTAREALGHAGPKPSCEPFNTAPKNKKGDDKKKGKKGKQSGNQGGGQKNGPDQDARKAAKHAAKHSR